MAKNKKKEKPAEDKHDKFKRVVTPRVQKALKMIGLIGRQAAPGYTYKEKDVADIITALREAVDAVEQQYTAKGTQQADFALD